MPRRRRPIGTLPAVAPVVHIRNILDWVGRVPWLGVRSYRCALLGSPAIVAEDNLAFIVPGETLEIASGADLPLDFRSVKLPITASNASAVRATATLDGSVVGSIDVDMDRLRPHHRLEPRRVDRPLLDQGRCRSSARCSSAT